MTTVMMIIVLKWNGGSPWHYSHHRFLKFTLTDWRLILFDLQFSEIIWHEFHVLWWSCRINGALLQRKKNSFRVIKLHTFLGVFSSLFFCEIIVVYLVSPVLSRTKPLRQRCANRRIHPIKNVLRLNELFLFVFANSIMTQFAVFFSASLNWTLFNRIHSVSFLKPAWKTFYQVSFFSWKLMMGFDCILHKWNHWACVIFAPKKQICDIKYSTHSLKSMIVNESIAVRMAVGHFFASNRKSMGVNIMTNSSAHFITPFIFTVK